MRLFLRTSYFNITRKLWIFTWKKKQKKHNADLHQAKPEVIVILFDTVQRIPPPFPLYSHDKLPALP